MSARLQVRKIFLYQAFTPLIYNTGIILGAVFLHANDTFGTAQRNAMDNIFPNAGLPFRLLESIAYDPKAQDLSVEVTKIRALNPDLLLVVTRAADAMVFPNLVSANLTVVPGGGGLLSLYPGNAFPLGTSSVNFGPGQVRATNSILELATDGTGTVGVLNGAATSTQFLLDVNGYFQ